MWCVLRNVSMQPAPMMVHFSIAKTSQMLQIASMSVYDKWYHLQCGYVQYDAVISRDQTFVGWWRSSHWGVRWRRRKPCRVLPSSRWGARTCHWWNELKESVFVPGFAKLAKCFNARQKPILNSCVYVRHFLPFLLKEHCDAIMQKNVPTFDQGQTSDATVSVTVTDTLALAALLVTVVFWVVTSLSFDQ